ncbi:MAG TPA: HAD family hydrolase [Chroococcales cyanobacterium]
MDNSSNPSQSDKSSLGATLSREAQLGVGFGHGLADAVSDTWSDLSKATRDPLGATEEFLANHWQDAVVGAAITFLNPRGAANAALLLYASRGLIGSVGSAMVQASHSDANMTAINARLENSVAQQGTDFAESLPLAMAGGAVGRLGADSLFGKGMGALDMVPTPMNGFEPKVTASDVKANFWNIHDQISPPPMKVLVTDVDGTLGPFSDYFAPGVRDSITKMSAETGVPEQELYERLGTVMDANRAHDYPWTLEQSGLMERLNMTPEQFTSQVVKPFWEGMDQAREQLLKPFPGTEETLSQLRDRGVRIIARSDAPYFIGLARLKTMGLLPYIDEFYAMATPTPEASAFSDPALLAHGEQRVQALSSDNSSFERTEALPRSSEKPNVGNLSDRLHELGVRPSQVGVFGDSRIKDGGLAQNIGAKFYYAVFGAHPAQEYQDVFNRLRNTNSSMPSTSLPDTMGPQRKVYPPIAYEAAHYSDILNLMERRIDGDALGKQLKQSLWAKPSLKPAYAYSLSEPVVPATSEKQARS